MASNQELYHHLVLAAKVPTSQPDPLEPINRSLIDYAIKACNFLRQQSSTGPWDSLLPSLEKCRSLNHDGMLSKSSLEQAFREIGDKTLILHVASQNAGLLIRPSSNGSVIFEAFEASPSLEAVLGAKNALLCDFPGRAAQIPASEFQNDSFRTSLALFLEKASIETLNGLNARAVKKQTAVIETRDTADCALVSQMLMSLLIAIGGPVSTLRFRKRVRDDVNFDNAKKPWRRAPMWLILRVTVRQMLCLELGNEAGRATYKMFICVVLAQFLEQTSKELAVEMVMTLRAKLCRRLAKLESDKVHASESARPVYDQLFACLSPWFKTIIQVATQEVTRTWELHKASVQRKISILPSKPEIANFKLKLENSGNYLHSLLYLNPYPLREIPCLDLRAMKSGMLGRATKFAERYLKLAELEDKTQQAVEREIQNPPSSTDGYRLGCLRISETIIKLIAEVGDAYDNDPAQMSHHILNVLYSWVSMDYYATSFCPLLSNYHPFFTPESLDLLHLPSLSDMARLHEIQEYLKQRATTAAESKTIFAPPSSSSFGVRYIRECNDQDRLTALWIDIDEECHRTEQHKKQAWVSALHKYEDLNEKMHGAGPCLCIQISETERDVSKCLPCWCKRQMRRMVVEVHEDYLPGDEDEAATVVFELCAPDFFTAYRNATWKIHQTLALQGVASQTKPADTLLSYCQLKDFASESAQSSTVTLPSVSKSWLSTHYKKLEVRNSPQLEDIVLPLALRFEYYDKELNCWVKDHDHPFQLARLCGVSLPDGFGPIQGARDGGRTTRLVREPSSYEIVANQTKCPTTMSPAEFTAHQNLLSGTSRRWLTMLLELNTPNLNFSSEETSRLFSELITQAGTMGKSNRLFRDAHIMFKDDAFCTRLVEQVERRLATISWRDVFCMDVIISITLRLHELGSSSTKCSADKLLMNARHVTLQWLKELRVEVRDAAQEDIAARASEYGRWAAILCRRTFSAHSPKASLSLQDLVTFLEAAIGLQENMLVDVSKLSHNFKLVFVRDLKAAYRLQSTVSQAIKTHPQVIETILNPIWPNPTSAPRTFSDLKFMSSPNSRWIEQQINTHYGTWDQKYTVQFNFMEGYLLIDGKPPGTLPAEIRDAEIVKELFGNQHLITLPSPMPGMSHLLRGENHHKHQVHFGTRDGQVIIRAQTTEGTVLELIPRCKFRQVKGHDIPASLIDDCFHWMTISDKANPRLEIRHGKPWRQHAHNWVIDLKTRIARRRDQRLIDPQSKLFQMIEQNFKYFENPENLLVYQPGNKNIMVKLERLGLTFRVNHRGLLESRELRSEMDPNQDAGTLYGFMSKICLRDLQDPSQRSIITAMGVTSWTRQGSRTVVQAAPVGHYGLFTIDNVLGRLWCLPEPRNLYAKALFHALTSSPFPDPLTGRTGREEAQHILQSGPCQPWQPLDNDGLAMLQFIHQHLCPRREYYPPNQRKLQTAIWETHSSYAQHDGYDAIVRSIIAKSNRLSSFHNNTSTPPSCSSVYISHLRERGLLRQSLYETSSYSLSTLTGQGDELYRSRDWDMTSQRCSNVFRIVRQVTENMFKFDRTKRLLEILEDWKVIGGFKATPEHDFFSLIDAIERMPSNQFGSMVSFCCNIPPGDKYALPFRLAPLVFRDNADIDLAVSLAAFSRIKELKALELPKGHFFTDFRRHESPTLDMIQGIIRQHFTELPVPVNLQSAKSRSKFHKEQAYHKQLCDSEEKRIAELIRCQWPTEALSFEGIESPVIDCYEVLQTLKPRWQQLWDNYQLSLWVDSVDDLLSKHSRLYELPTMFIPTKDRPYQLPRRKSVVPSIADDLLPKSGPKSLLLSAKVNESQSMHLSALGPKADRREDSVRPEYQELDCILVSLAKESGSIRQEYANDLRRSLKALQSAPRRVTLDIRPTLALMESQILSCEQSIGTHMEAIQQSWSDDDSGSSWLTAGGLWPIGSKITMMEQLRSVAENRFGDGMKSALVSLGIMLTRLQKLRRMRHAHLQGNNQRVLDELANPGHTNWDAEEYPDFLLLELENNILIRDEQFEVAQAIISPNSKSNSVLQLNMGKGKTSVITPMAAAVLADKQQLCRLIVPKALLLQTAQIMQSRLGGLVGREIRHLPFSRRTKAGPEMLDVFEELHHEIFNSGGVILALPESIMSFSLSGLQSMVDSKSKQARQMVEFQHWLTETSRDILDESDVTLAVKTQLIYPSGTEKPVDGHPHRWHVAQALLGLVEAHVPDLRQRFGRRIEVENQGSTFPRIHILDVEVEQDLKQRIIDDVCAGKSSIFHLSDCVPPSVRARLKHALSDPVVDDFQISKAKRAFVDRNSAADKILLLRGLIHSGILLLCLKKRWNVQYGLHPDRIPIAVPFEAKGVPSANAEFGHPDVAIIFTCLAFYYSGLTLKQFTECLGSVLKSDDPQSEYDIWTQGCANLPQDLRQWNLINAEDHLQVEQLWKLLRVNRAVLNYYLNTFVFPKHCKQFEVKLQTSGWDIPLFPRMTDKQAESARTTGFSGTNDNKYLLPLTIKQDDLPSLSQTNAEVLSYLLEERNRGYEKLADHSGRRLTEYGLLKRLSQTRIRILIDAGAFVLEMKNLEVAKEWLKLDTFSPAAIFFNEENKAMVLSRGSKKPIPLLATPYAENLAECLVYLDEAHTRGTDLKLPQNACGALTLALNQTKDHTVQAAMRLRQLGTTQSVVFCAPPEVDHDIRKVCHLRWLESIHSGHCVRWLLEMTCRANESLRPLYVAQGTDFCKRINSAWENSNFVGSTKHREAHMSVILQKECSTLKEIYGSKAQNPSSDNASLTITNPKLRSFYDTLTKKKKDLAHTTSKTLACALDEVEQEREVEFQVEEIRQVRKPTHYDALEFPGMHTNILRFIENGVLRGTDGYEHAFTALGRTTLGRKYEVRSTGSKLYVSAEFRRTVSGGNAPSDDFFRPVEWILYAPRTRTALLLIPEEAEIAIPMLRAAKNRSPVHLIPYASPVTRNMTLLGRLTYYAFPSLPKGTVIPNWLTIEIGILAGRLYFEFAEYGAIVTYLQAGRASEAEGEGTEDDYRQTSLPVDGNTEVAFAKNPLGFVLDWLTQRRRGQDITHTPMGYVCQRRKLSAEHPFFRSSEAEVSEVGGTSPKRRSNEEGESDSDGEYDLVEMDQSDDDDDDRNEENVGGEGDESDDANPDALAEWDLANELAR
ncbi:hypothetical protein QBC32DRAFT_382607 [Pseudoneurospora amorphoporcata]|uniref:ubiquitinyl hydrolase 1 n=1 Tax=Pseudoneurospora amorphoporcata TaxID=241081 RepID=A0AAN6NMT0_9PEZI|nr:hypothetical protein QBC32DRAFT_382607 [Pseudoneurospora amorphoporcata]